MTPLNIVLLVFVIANFVGSFVFSVVFLLIVTDIQIYDAEYYPSKRKEQTKKRWRYMFAKKRVVTYFLFPFTPVLLLLCYMFYLIFYRFFMFLGTLTD